MRVVGRRFTTSTSKQSCFVAAAQTASTSCADGRPNLCLMCICICQTRPTRKNRDQGIIAILLRSQYFPTILRSRDPVHLHSDRTVRRDSGFCKPLQGSAFMGCNQATSMCNQNECSCGVSYFHESLPVHPMLADTGLSTLYSPP